MNEKTKFYLKITKSAIKKAALILSERDKKYSAIRIYITGGGCNGFKYNFKKDHKTQKNDITITYSNVKFIIDPISIQYVKGGTLDYLENFSGSKFILINPNAKQTCSCGTSFNT